MTIAEYIDQHKKGLEIFKEIIVVDDGEFKHYYQGWSTLPVILKDCGDREIWNAVVKNQKMFFQLEPTDKPRGGMTVKSYLFKHKNILGDMEGVVLWFGKEQFVYAIDHLDDIFSQGYRDRKVKDIAVSRDLFIHLNVEGKLNHFNNFSKQVTSDVRIGTTKGTRWFTEGMDRKKLRKVPKMFIDKSKTESIIVSEQGRENLESESKGEQNGRKNVES